MSGKKESYCGKHQFDPSKNLMAICRVRDSASSVTHQHDCNQEQTETATQLKSTDDLFLGRPVHRLRLCEIQPILRR
jgi:hypothetical protein